MLDKNPKLALEENNLWMNLKLKILPGVKQTPF